MPATLLVLLLAAVVAGAVAQRATGIGFTLIAGPVCAIALDANDALGTMIRLAVLADVAVLLGDRSGISWRDVGTYLWPAALAFPLAIGATMVVPADALLVVAALATIVAAILLVPRRRAPMRLPHPVAVAPGGAPRPLAKVSPRRPVARGAVSAGFASGFLGVATGMAGPPLALHASVSGRSMSTNRATMTAFFLVVDAAALVAHPHGASGRITVLLAVALAAGLALGQVAITRVSDVRIRRAIPPLVITSACAALVRVLG